MLYRLHTLLLFLVALAATAHTAHAADLKIAVAADTPPFVFSNGGEPAGFNVELTRALCAAMQAQCTLLPLPKNRLLAALEDGAVDAIVALPVDEDYGEELIFSDRFYKQGARFVRHKGDKKKIAYKKMAGSNVGVVADSLYDVFLTEKFPGVNVKRYGSMDAAYAALAGGEVEYVLGERVAQFLWASEQDGFEVAGPNYTTGKYFADVAIAVSSDSLRDEFNAALKTTREDGTYKTINKKYLPFNLYGRK